MLPVGQVEKDLRTDHLTMERSVTSDLDKNSVRAVVEAKSLIRIGLKENGRRN